MRKLTSPLSVITFFGINFHRISGDSHLRLTLVERRRKEIVTLIFMLKKNSSLNGSNGITFSGSVFEMAKQTRERNDHLLMAQHHKWRMKFACGSLR